MMRFWQIMALVLVSDAAPSLTGPPGASAAPPWTLNQNTATPTLTLSNPSGVALQTTGDASVDFSLASGFAWPSTFAATPHEDGAGANIFAPCAGAARPIGGGCVMTNGTTATITVDASASCSALHASDAGGPFVQCLNANTLALRAGDTLPHGVNTATVDSVGWYCGYTSTSGGSFPRAFVTCVSD